MWEADAPDPSVLSSWLGLGLSIVGLYPSLPQPYAISVGALSLILSTVGVYDSTTVVAPAKPETDTLYFKQAMWRAAFRTPKSGVKTTSNAATLIRVHVVNQTKVVITRAQQTYLPQGNVMTSKIFADPGVAKDLFSIIMPDELKILPFRIYEIAGLVPQKGPVTTDNTWFKGPAAVTFTRGELATVNTSTIDRTTLTRHGHLSIEYPKDTILFKYNSSAVLICVKDQQTIGDDGYDFFWIGNTDKLTFLRLSASKIAGLAGKIDIGFISSEDTLKLRIAGRYKGYRVYWIEPRKDPGTNKNADYLCAGNLGPNTTISAADDYPTRRVMVRITNWHSELRTVKVA
ncbi:hypothetical protein CPB83DRAFT_911749 [Crepidotus variabilis]|uniref:Uncharacterized protein n=1 Tax=Crepidotus variabilis TaxID=179855 RepID=A0A9P6E2W2_9AGAR|nr:hypothetical protein CPB83DRAFT_911749 [Crepidotus variabilis]